MAVNVSLAVETQKIHFPWQYDNVLQDLKKICTPTEQNYYITNLLNLPEIFY
jgi:hypothetical protein